MELDEEQKKRAEMTYILGLWFAEKLDEVLSGIVGKGKPINVQTVKQGINKLKIKNKDARILINILVKYGILGGDKNADKSE